MSGLPKGWVKVELGDVVLPLETCDPSKEGDVSFRYVDIGSINNRTFLIESPKSLLGREAPSRARRRIRQGDVLFSTVRTYLKNISMVPEELDGEVRSTGIAVLRSSGALVPEFLFSTVRSDHFIRELSLKQDGTLYPAITDRDLLGHQFSLPPLAEQKRIVAKLDALNAKSTRARIDLARIETLVSRYKQAVLSKAFSGELTKDWRNGRAGISEWRNLPLDQLISDGPTNGWSPKADGTLSGLKSLKLSATSSGKLRLDTETIKYLDQEISGNSKYWLLPNDILIQRANSLELLGTTVLFDGPPREFIYPDLMMRIRGNHAKIHATYLATYLNSDPARSYFRAHATGTAGNMPKINGAVVRGTPVPTPVLDEQHEIVRRIESAFARIERLAAQAKRALELVGKLDEAILAKAFRGELVPQDDNDEPADKLLERIRAERAAAPKAKRGRGRTA
jgi:type I restriction enzyme, S subunit